MKKDNSDFPPQHQDRMPGRQTQLIPKPLVKGEWYNGSGKLLDKVAIITGGDSGIGQSVAVFFAREGANISVVYLEEHKDAEGTRRLVEEEGRQCLLIPADVRYEEACENVVEETVKKFGRLDIIVNNAAWQPYQNDISSLTKEQLDRTFYTNIYSYFFMVKSALPHLKEGSSIINNSSVTAYRGSSRLLDYSTSKSAIVGFTRSLSQILVKKGIRVNGVAPGPVWTPLTTSTLSDNEIKVFGKKVPMERAAQPEEIAPAFVFLAAQDSSYITGQFIHPNGGELINT